MRVQFVVPPVCSTAFRRKAEGLSVLLLRIPLKSGTTNFQQLSLRIVSQLTVLQEKGVEIRV